MLGNNTTHCTLLFRSFRSTKFIFSTPSCHMCDFLPPSRQQLPVLATWGTVDFCCISLHICVYWILQLVAKCWIVDWWSPSICDLFHLWAEVGLLSCFHLHHFACPIELEWLHLQEGDGHHKKAADGWSEIKCKQRMCTNLPISLLLFGNNYTGQQTGDYVKDIRREWTEVNFQWRSEVSFTFTY